MNDHLVAMNPMVFLALLLCILGLSMSLLGMLLFRPLRLTEKEYGRLCFGRIKGVEYLGWAGERMHRLRVDGEEIVIARAKDCSARTQIAIHRYLREIERI